MKRTSLRRRKPTYPTAAQLQERREWASRFDRCWLCGAEGWRLAASGVCLEVHEIASRAQAVNKWADVRSYFRTCRTCHDDILSWLPESVQCAFKLLNDIDNYDRSWINQARGEADTSITEGEVVAWQKFIKALRVNR